MRAPLPNEQIKLKMKITPETRAYSYTSATTGERLKVPVEMLRTFRGLKVSRKENGVFA